MSGWMEVLATSPEPEVIRAIVPTIALPLTAVLVAANVVATWIARLFRVELKWEGPNRLLEVLLKPRVLISAVLLNLAVWGLYSGYRHWSNRPAALWRIEWMNQRLAKAAGESWKGRSYGESVSATAKNPLAVGAGYQQLWRTQLPQAIFSSVALAGESAFVGSDDGYVYELDRKSGVRVRQFFIGTQVTPAPVIWKGHLVVGEGAHLTHGARIYLFDLSTGLLKASFSSERGHTEGQPTIFEDRGVERLFAPAGVDGVYALNPSDLSLVWQVKVGHTDSEVRVDRGRAFFSTGVEKGYADRSHFAVAVDFHSGAILWKKELPASGWMAPVFVGDQVCFGSGEIYLPSNAGWLTCLDQSSGETRAQATLGAPVVSTPVLHQGLILVGDWNGELCAFNVSGLSKQWCIKTEGKHSFASPTVDLSGRVLYPTDKKGLWLLEAQTGTLRAQLVPTEGQGKWVRSFSRVVVESDGAYLSDAAGNVRKFVVPSETGGSQ